MKRRLIRFADLQKKRRLLFLHLARRQTSVGFLMKINTTLLAQRNPKKGVKKSAPRKSSAKKHSSKPESHLNLIREIKGLRHLLGIKGARKNKAVLNLYNPTLRPSQSPEDVSSMRENQTFPGKLTCMECVSKKRWSAWTNILMTL